MSHTGPHLVSGVGDCDGAVYSYIYSVVDECGRTASCTQLFTVNNHGPTVICPADMTVECKSDIMAGTPTIFIDCGLMTTTTTSGPVLVSGQDECDGAEYELTYIVEDECGRTSTCVQTFTLENEGPTIECPADKTIECVSQIVEGTPVVTSSCGLSTQVFVAMPTIVGETANCPGNEYFILYTAEDECGRFVTCTQKFTIENEGPTIVCPKDVTLAVITDFVPGTPVTTSSCGLTTTITTDGPHLVNGNDCDGAIYRYTYTVTDACGRTASCDQSIIITPSDLACTASGTDTYCGFDNGSASVTVTGGFAPYTYLWNNGSTASALSDLAPGVYTVVVTDNIGCTTNCSVTIKPSTSPEISIYKNDTKCGFSNGSATANVISGTPPYSYMWSNGSTTQSISNLYPDTYSVTVTDAEGCTDEESVVILPSTSPELVVDKTDTSCGFDNGSASATTSLGTPPYTYSWSNGATTSSITGLAPGSYSVTVTDSENCTDKETVSIHSSSSPTCTVMGTDASCGDSNGSATVNAVGGTPGYTYLWSTGSTNQTITGLNTGTYTVTVTDAAGCITSCHVNISNTTPPTCTVSGVNTTCGYDNGSATVFPFGGSGSYTYLWNNGATTATISDLAPGSYSVEVTDSNGCSTECSVTIHPSSSPSCTISSTDTSCGESNGTATGTASGGTAPYTYAWSNGGNTPTITNLTPGTYTLVVTDAAGCTSSCYVTIGDSDSPTCHINGTDTSCGENNGSASVVASGGSGGYTYLWSNGSTSSDN